MPTRKGLAFCRADGLVGALPAQRVVVARDRSSPLDAPASLTDRGDLVGVIPGEAWGPVRGVRLSGHPRRGLRAWFPLTAVADGAAAPVVLTLAWAAAEPAPALRELLRYCRRAFGR